MNAIVLNYIGYMSEDKDPLALMYNLRSSSSKDDMSHRITTIPYPYTLIITRVYMINTRFENFFLKHKTGLNILYQLNMFKIPWYFFFTEHSTRHEPMSPNEYQYYDVFFTIKKYKHTKIMKI